MTELAEGFARACDARPDEVFEGVFQSGGAPVYARVAGREAAAILSRSLASGAGDGPGLRLDLWDEEATGVGFEPADWGNHRWRAWAPGERLRISADGRYVRFSGLDFDVRLDRESEYAVGWLRSERLLSSWHRARPLQMLLLTWIASRGLTAVHAAMVARDGRGVLLAGPTRRGKSTVAAACAAAGFDVFGDEVIALEPSENGVIGHGVYTAVKLRREGLDRHPTLDGMTITYGEPWNDEAVAFLGEVFPGQVPGCAQLAVLAFPMLDDAETTSFAPIGAGRAARELIGCILSAEPGNVAAGFAVVTAAAERVPAYRLRIGTATERVPKRVEALLSAPVPARGG